jgi:biotin carboxyl carrier protein
VAAVTVRATLRGPHEGLVDPSIVDPQVPGGELRTSGGRRATLAATGDDLPHQVLVLPVEGGEARARPAVEVVVDGWRFEVEVEPEHRAALRERARRDRGDAGHSGPAEVHAIIPGVVVSVAVAAGDPVSAGQQLLVIEAMKMQNELRAPRAGTVSRVTVGERSTIEVGDLLVVIE